MKVMQVRQVFHGQPCLKFLTEKAILADYWHKHAVLMFEKK